MNARAWARRIGLGLVAVAWLLAAPAVAQASVAKVTDHHYAVTCDGDADNVDMASAISSVTAGGRVTIGAGTCAIAATVTINKALVFAGAGGTSTVFTGAASVLLQVMASNVRVTGIYFNQAGNIYATLVTGPISGFRYDHNRCDLSKWCVEADGRVEGVLDHNTFVNCNLCTYVSGAGESAWAVDYNAAAGTPNAGSANMLFFDYNIYTRTNDTSGDNQVWYIQSGARSVFRYNTVDFSTWTECGYCQALDIHGNQDYYDEGNAFRGQPISEVYWNTLTLGSSVRAAIDVRSGALLFWNNTITAAGADAVELWEEEAWQTAHFSTLDTTWPTEDSCTNVFLWGNTLNGNALTTGDIRDTSTLNAVECCAAYPDDTYVLNYNRDVWMHAPEATGGRTYYTDRAGAAGNGADGTLAFTAEGANAFYPYTPYTYPHPLTANPAFGAQPTVVSNGANTPLICWTASDTVPVSHFTLSVDGAAGTDIEKPTSGVCPAAGAGATAFGYAFPTLDSGQHTLTLAACSGSDCTASTSLIVVVLR